MRLYNAVSCTPMGTFSSTPKGSFSSCLPQPPTLAFSKPSVVHHIATDPTVDGSSDEDDSVFHEIRHRHPENHYSFDIDEKERTTGLESARESQSSSSSTITTGIDCPIVYTSTTEDDDDTPIPVVVHVVSTTSERTEEGGRIPTKSSKSRENVIESYEEQDLSISSSYPSDEHDSCANDVNPPAEERCVHNRVLTGNEYQGWVTFDTNTDPFDDYQDHEYPWILANDCYTNDDAQLLLPWNLASSNDCWTPFDDTSDRKLLPIPPAVRKFLGHRLQERYQAMRTSKASF